MAIVNINLEDVPVDFTVVGIGVYVCEVQEEPGCVDKGEGKGNMVTPVLTITDEGEFNGEKLFDNICLWTKMGKRAMKRFTVGAGVESGPEGVDLADFVGKSVRVSVTHEMYKGKPTARVNEYVLEDNSVDEVAGDL